MDEDYVPEKLPGREEEIEQIMQFIGILEVGKPPNILITGPKGTGKTAIVRYVLRMLKPNFKRDRLIYVQATTPIATLSSIAEQLEFTWKGTRRRFIGIPRGVSIGEALKFLKNKMKENRIRYVVIAIDEADKLVGNIYGEEILYHFSRNLPVSLILITNKPLLIDKINDDRVRSSLKLKHIALPRYDDQQILQILRYRASLAFRERSYDDEILKWIRDITANEMGRDIRFALDVLMEAGDEAYRQKARKITFEHVSHALVLSKERMIARLISKYDIVEQAIIYVMANIEIASAGKLYDYLEEILGVSRSRIRLAVRELRLMEFIDLVEKGLGKTKGKAFYLKWTGQYDNDVVARAVLPEVKKLVNGLISRFRISKLDDFS